jgi:hypothetical protein
MAASGEDVAGMRINGPVTSAEKKPSGPGPGTSGQRPTHSEDGVDLTLIRWMLSLTPEERIRALEDNVYSLMRLKDGTVAP